VFSKEAASTLTKITWVWPLLGMTAFPSAASLSKTAWGIYLTPVTIQTPYLPPSIITDNYQIIVKRI
jgi:hypothetical protein